MKIIGHRGAAGLALENTLSSFELANLIGVDSIEIDIQKTSDNHIVVIHDNDLKRVSLANKSALVNTHTLSQIRKIKLRDEQSKIPTLEQALEAIGKTPVIIELKASGCSQQLLSILDKYPKANVTIASFKLNELALLRELRPKLRLFGLERTKPVEIIQIARMLKLDGIGLNFWLLNPLTYWMSKRAKLDLYVYTVNSKFIGRLIGFMYPKVAVCTDHPEYFVKHPYPIVKSMENARKSNNTNR